MYCDVGCILCICWKMKGYITCGLCGYGLWSYVRDYIMFWDSFAEITIQKCFYQEKSKRGAAEFF